MVDLRQTDNFVCMGKVTYIYSISKVPVSQLVDAVIVTSSLPFATSSSPFTSLSVFTFSSDQINETIQFTFDIRKIDNCVCI